MKLQKVCYRCGTRFWTTDHTTFRVLDSGSVVCLSCASILKAEEVKRMLQSQFSTLDRALALMAKVKDQLGNATTSDARTFLQAELQKAIDEVNRLLPIDQATREATHGSTDYPDTMPPIPGLPNAPSSNRG